MTTTSPESPALRPLLERLCDRPVSPEIAAMAEHLAARPGVVAVLFYGAQLRDAGSGGPLDFYVLTQGDAAYHGRGLAALANRLLPPNVYHERLAGPPPISAKVAVMRLAAFRRRMRRESLDTTLWARFCQPVVLVWARDGAARAAVLDALEEAGAGAAWWAVRLAPEGSDAAACWQALFAHTYGVELRVERGGRVRDLTAASPELYAALHAALIAGRSPSATERRWAMRSWAWRRRLGKALNLARLVKAAATFRGGIDYALAKIERHSGAPVVLRPWERRWPVLGAPFVFVRLLREKRLR